MRLDYTVTRLSVTAIKGLSLRHPDSIELTTRGVVGDRLFYLVDDDEALQSCTRHPGLYGLSAAYDADGRRLVVARDDEVLVDGIAEVGAPVEDTWTGERLQVGGAVLRAGGPVKRCAATTRNPDSGAVDLQTLRLILDYRGRQDSELGLGANFGIYGAVLEPGTISVGDSLSVCAGGTPVRTVAHSRGRSGHRSRRGRAHPQTRHGTVADVCARDARMPRTQRCPGHSQR
ncbi:hypothetical protein JCM18899A_43130 [Nocardioides sp. AN3]